METEDNVYTTLAQTEEIAEAKENGALTVLGKFKDVGALARAYESLQAEFTRRSQRLRQLEKESENFKMSKEPSGAEKLRKAAKTKREERKEFDAFIEEFEKEGYRVDLMINPKHKDVQPILGDYEAVLLNCRMSSENYHGATLRIGWNNIMVLWRAYVLQHPNFVFTSFGDPYKLYDAPYLKTYINAYSGDPTSQRAAAKVLLGKLKPQGKNPVAFKGFFCPLVVIENSVGKEMGAGSIFKAKATQKPNSAASVGFSPTVGLPNHNINASTVGRTAQRLGKGGFYRLHTTFANGYSVH